MTGTGLCEVSHTPACVIITRTIWGALGYSYLLMKKLKHREVKLPARGHTVKSLSKEWLSDFPLWLSGLRTWVVFMRLRVRPLASLSGLRIWRCCEPRMWLGFLMAVAVMQAGSCSLIQLLAQELPHAAVKKKKKKRVDLSSWVSKAPAQFPSSGGNQGYHPGHLVKMALFA